MSSQILRSGNAGPGASSAAKPDREVIRCSTCGLVQYRPAANNCRRCAVPLQPAARPILQRAASEPSAPADASTAPGHLNNSECVENVGIRIVQFRKSKKLTQTKLSSLTGVSRSYLSRIEHGEMSPSLAILEKLSAPLDVAVNDFFVLPSSTMALLEDSFVRKIQPYLRRLDAEQWDNIVTRLAAISNVVAREKQSTAEGSYPDYAKPHVYRSPSERLGGPNSSKRGWIQGLAPDRVPLRRLA